MPIKELSKIVNFFFGDNYLVQQYTTALRAGDVDACINCVRCGNGEQKKKMQGQRNLFYNTNK